MARAASLTLTERCNRVQKQRGHPRAAPLLMPNALHRAHLSPQCGQGDRYQLAIPRPQRPPQSRRARQAGCGASRREPGAQEAVLGSQQCPGWTSHLGRRCLGDGGAVGVGDVCRGQLGGRWPSRGLAKPGQWTRSDWCELGPGGNDEHDHSRGPRPESRQRCPRWSICHHQRIEWAVPGTAATGHYSRLNGHIHRECVVAHLLIAHNVELVAYGTDDFDTSDHHYARRDAHPADDQHHHAGDYHHRAHHHHHLSGQQRQRQRRRELRLKGRHLVETRTW